MTQHYELTYIVPINYLEGDLTKIMENVVSLVKKQGGEITHDEIFGKQKLAYPINHIHQGTYIVVEFNMESESLKQLDTDLKLTNEVLRHLIIKKRIKSADEIAREKVIYERLRQEKEQELKDMEAKENSSVKKNPSRTYKKVEKMEEPVVTVETEEVEKPKEVKLEKKQQKDTDLEALDKKLDEILTEEII